MRRSAGRRCWLGSTALEGIIKPAVSGSGSQPRASVGESFHRTSLLLERFDCFQCTRSVDAAGGVGDGEADLDPQGDGRQNDAG